MAETDNIPLRETALYQLNMLLWLVWPVSTLAVDGFRPVFREAGYVLQAIAPPLAVPLESRIRIRDRNIPINSSASPEVLLRHDQTLILLPIECKRSSFGPESDTSAQARALLSLKGADIARNIPLQSEDEWKSCLLYAVKGGDQDAMFETLVSLKSSLLGAGVPVEEIGSFAIDVMTDGVYLEAASGCSLPVAAFEGTADGRVKIMALDDGDDPRRLYLVPFDPSIDVNDEYGKRVVEERIRVAVATAIGSQLDNPEFEVAEDQIMDMALEIWSYWKDSGARSSLMRGVRRYLDQILQVFNRLGVRAERSQGTLRFLEVNQEQALEIRRYFMSAAYRRGEINPWTEYFQLGFSDLPDAPPSWSE